MHQGDPENLSVSQIVTEDLFYQTVDYVLNCLAFLLLNDKLQYAIISYI